MRHEVGMVNGPRPAVGGVVMDQEAAWDMRAGAGDTAVLSAAGSWTVNAVADLAPRMFQTLIVESFENSDRIVAVGREAIGLRADYVLKTELREFQAEFPQPLLYSNEGGIGNVAPPTIRVRINAKLIKMPRRSIVASKNFEYLIDAKENSMAEIIGAFDTALGQTMRRMVERTLTIGEKNDDPRDKAARRRQ